VCMSCGGGRGGTDNESSKLSHHQLLETPSHAQILVEITIPSITTHYLSSLATELIPVIVASKLVLDCGLAALDLLTKPPH